MNEGDTDFSTEEQALSAAPFIAAVLLAEAAMAESDARFDPREQCLEALVAGVRPILDSQDTQTGRFGTQPWICNDQNVLFPLAAAWSIEDPKSPWHHDPRLLDAIILGGDALVDDQDRNGMWTFRKKDGSTWGQIAQPWTYTRWIRAFALIKDAMPPARRAKWEKGLLLGYDNIARRELRRVHNIPCHHAMGLAYAAEVFGRDDWKRQAKAFMKQVVAEQHADGWWTEHAGPVVRYNFVYSESIGCYYALTGDKSVLPALERAAAFHARLTYPDGSIVETVDERNPYHPGEIHLGNVGLSVTAEGRGWLARQVRLFQATGKKIGADWAAQMLLYGRSGPAAETAADRDEDDWTSGDGKIVVLRRKPWFVVASAYTAEVPNNRWIQDRQNFVSVFHDRAGLIVGGGNTKLQPYWSNFTVGDRALLSHKPGDASPNFISPAGLVHVPTAAAAALVTEGTAAKGVRVTLTYGKQRGLIEVLPVDETTLRVVYACTPKGAAAVHGHLTLLPHVGRVIRPPGADPRKLDGTPIDADGIAPSPVPWGPGIQHAGWRLDLPPGARLRWPCKAHNPYRKTGHSSLDEARLVVEMPFDRDHTRYEFSLAVK